MHPVIWIIIIIVAIIVVVAIVRASSAKKVGEYRKKQPGLSFGRLDRALQKDSIHREAGEFTIAMDLSEVDLLIESGEYDLAAEKVREYLKAAEEEGDTLKIANMMGYLEKIELSKKRRF
jgi:hypothetical protein